MSETSWIVMDLESGNVVGEFDTLDEAKAVFQGYSGYAISQVGAVRTSTNSKPIFTHPAAEAATG